MANTVQERYVPRLDRRVKNTNRRKTNKKKTDTYTADRRDIRISVAVSALSEQFSRPLNDCPTYVDYLDCPTAVTDNKYESRRHSPGPLCVVRRRTFLIGMGTSCAFHGNTRDVLVASGN